MARHRRRVRKHRVSVKRVRHHRRRRAAVPIMYAANPRRRRRHRNEPARRHRRSRRSYRRNPEFSTGFVMEAAWVTGGYFGTRFAVGFVTPMLGGMADNPLVRIAAKGGVAFGLGWLAQQVTGKRQGQLVMLGGFVEALADAVKTYVSPFVPALADSSMGTYPMISSYPTIGDGYSNPYVVGASAYAGHDESL